MNSINRKHFLLWLVVFAFCIAGCRHVPDLKLALDISVNITDDKGLISRHPFELVSYNENEVYLLIPPNKLVKYDVKTKQLTSVFDSIAFNIDSAVDNTYRIRNGIDYMPHDA
jgi:hypothetical protein